MAVTASTSATSYSSLLCVASIVIAVALSLGIQPSLAVFQTSSGMEGGLSLQEGASVYVALNNLLNFDGFDTTDWFESGVAFANVHTINGKSIALRYACWTQYCTVGTWETTRGDLVLDDFRTSVTYLRPFLLQGFSWAAVSNGYAWLDYHLFPTDATTLELPSSTSLLNVSITNTIVDGHEVNTTANVGDFASTLPRALISTVSRYSPVEKTGFIHCPVLPLVLLSHFNGIWDILHEGEYLTSANKRIQLVMQSDCNLVLSDTQSNGILWSSGTAERGSGCFVRLQIDANLVIYTGDGAPVWAIDQGCGCVKFSSLVIEDDGNLVLFRSENRKLYRVWATNTMV
ncbi:hypothetical protein SUGI_0728600 [Cryptomeria japonica]|uniref:uncharacterized protein LOC131040014 n=1 Tax=Cryptomeria japonica TaxID=3369 RepID=UPI0024147087|nr:uncharacterized protein LOC131040014 [Cryptomeria japonica]GLJ36289.1 hypothetical protein SUGI_0728520 [Cryptomeria japonica]GLJ36291.1 hypothetical protein SUGI_0728600 [Cryptomeria japonica]